MRKSLSLQRVFAWGSSFLLASAVLLMPVGSAFAISAQPDLTVDSIINVDGMLSIKVGNEGTRDVLPSEEEGARLHIYVNDVLRLNYLLSQLNDDLQEAGNATVLTPFGFGTTYLPTEQVNEVRVCVDATNQVSDSDPTNNCLTKSFLGGQEYTPQPDLGLHFVRNIGGILSIQVGNIGDRDVTADEAIGARLDIIVDGVLRRAYQLNQLNSDVLLMNQPPIITPFGFGTEYLSNNEDHVIAVCVDPTHVVEDSDTTNNCKTVTLRNNVEVPVPTQPDLTVHGIVNDGGALSIKVGNQGERDIALNELSTSRLYVYVDNALRRNYLLSQLNDEFLEAGNATVVTPFMFGIAYLANNENHTIRVCVDPTELIAESNETNNCNTVTLRNNVEVPDPTQPDLTVHGIVNDGGKLSIKVGNQGDADVSGSEAAHANLKIYTNGTLRRTYQLRRLNPDLLEKGNATVLTPFSFGISYLPNNHNNSVRVCVDTTDVIEESNEENNCMSVVLRNNVEVPVVAQPDLAVTNISKHGSAIRIKVQNLSGEAVRMESGKLYKFDVYVDGNLIYGYNWSTLSNQNFMDAWGTSVFSPLSDSSSSLSSGGYHMVRACIDTVNVVEESRESNNCFQTNIYSPQEAAVVEAPVATEVIETEPTTTIPTPPAGFEGDVLVATVDSPNPFADTSMTSQEGLAAATLYNNAIIGGYPDGTFGGNRAVNRAEAAKFLLLAQYGELGNFTNNGRFNDVLDGQWYVRFVVRAAQLGIIEGYSDGGFHPGAQVNTAEFLKMMTLTFDLPINLDHNFSDVASGTWYSSYAGIASQYNLFPNRGNMLRPGALLTRNEVAVAIYQYLVNR